MKNILSKLEKYIPLLVLLIVAVGFYLRVVPGLNEVFTPYGIMFRGVDSWYHIRLVDNFMANFPHLMKWDSYILYPEYLPVGYFPFLTIITGILGQIFNYEAVAALLPPIVGSVTLFLIYILGKEVCNKWVGLLAALLCALLPSELFHRSMLGFFDHHFLEVLFLVLVLIGLVVSNKNEKSIKPVILAGVSLGLYLSTWLGGLVLSVVILIIYVSLMVQKSYNGEKVEYTTRNYFIVLSIGSFFLLLTSVFVVIPDLILGIQLLINFLLVGLLGYYLMVQNWVKFLGGTLLVAGVAGLVLILTGPPELKYLVTSVLFSSDSTIGEAAPSNLGVLFSNYGLSFFLFVPGLFYYIKNKGNIIVGIPAIIFLILALGQRRWGYYFTIFDALLASYFVWVVLGKVKERTKVAVAIVLVAFILATTIPGALKISKLENDISKDWVSACTWIKDNTPNPFDDSNPYYQLEQNGIADYGILCWWDYGHWIIRIGQRVPVSSPTHQDSSIQWRVLLASSEEEANRVLSIYNIPYIILDSELIDFKQKALIAKANQYNFIPLETFKVEDTFMFQLIESKTTTWELAYENNSVYIYRRVK